MRIPITRMKRNIQYKTLDGGIKDVDTQSRTLKIAIASFGEANLDRDRDIILHSAATKTIKERGPKGTNEIWHLTDHVYLMEHALGKFSDLYVEGDYLIGISSPSRTRLGNDVMELYVDGHINQHSIGFGVIEEEQRKDGVNIIKQIALWEGSTVLWGANANTPTFGVAKSLTKAEASSMLERTIKSLRNGHYSDETFSLLELQLKAIQQYLLDIDEKATAPASETTQPVVKAVDYSGLLSEIKSVQNIYKN
ncbi:HK97 family phage prohead protease [Chitinophaga rhizosphaerae]|uniref:HK97 family phage prohead protease n=1 Tax=Chitinophaga rhizosphaerae TaxID=1864947 RepID=UPI000F80ED43|nr:HK97 family phage prohead protease [Chitinophaga rhizosphaerae]